ncbi:uncharacterized protein DNG_09303 [Cephalotrichum gorgonifer]|uniref:RNA ligase/cyclic nucleotide phosphodiesterase n=1 Tax=Cephalotrichum gorgonifer TaxID=2041049 RepID=A0AAE8SZA1_9PEZI|nr:uncharacterized protein DNG_09303 [Cephalotrichum gorgonifer]
MACPHLHPPAHQTFLDFISAHDNSPAKIQAKYSEHRTGRNAQQHDAFLSPSFAGVTLEYYLKLTEASPSPYAPDGIPLDPRNSLVLWARPPEHIIQLASHIGAKLKETAPHLWVMPPHRMHLTTLEISHSKTPAYITEMVQPLRPHVSRLTNHTLTHRSRLVKPYISYDLSGVALSFLPAAGEPHLSPRPSPAGTQQTVEVQVVQGDAYTYHHLRHDLTTILEDAGITIEPRYQVPSAHITLARYLVQHDHATPAARKRWVAAIEEVNAWLEETVWDVAGGEFIGEWVLGQERGLDLRCGTVWYGGGRTIMTGEGF